MPKKTAELHEVSTYHWECPYCDFEHTQEESEWALPEHGSNFKCAKCGKIFKIWRCF